MLRFLSTAAIPLSGKKHEATTIAKRWNTNNKASTATSTSLLAHIHARTGSSLLALHHATPRLRAGHPTTCQEITDVAGSRAGLRYKLPNLPQTCCTYKVLDMTHCVHREKMDAPPLNHPACYDDVALNIRGLPFGRIPTNRRNPTRSPRPLRS